jgi:hypothetical protein
MLTVGKASVVTRAKNDMMKQSNVTMLERFCVLTTELLLGTIQWAIYMRSMIKYNFYLDTPLLLCNLHQYCGLTFLCHEHLSMEETQDC